MGVGHVPPGEVPSERAGADISRRQRRGTRAVRTLPLGRPRPSLGELGERLAAQYLTDKGLVVVDTNVRVGRCEIDLVAYDTRSKVVVEVRSSTGSIDPIDAVDEAKRRHVQKLARVIGADRVDFLGLRVGESGIDVHWLPGGN